MFFLCLVTAYCGFLDFWNTAQTEIWVLFFIVLGWWLALPAQASILGSAGVGDGLWMFVGVQTHRCDLGPCCAHPLWVHLWQVYGGLPSLRRAVLQYTGMGSWRRTGWVGNRDSILVGGAFPAMVDTLIAYDLGICQASRIYSGVKMGVSDTTGSLTCPVGLRQCGVYRLVSQNIS